jgi:hypothetical protein
MNVTRVALLAATAAVLLVTSTAQADAFRVSGGGQTHKGATLGFTAASDRTGELTYHRDDGTFSLHCSRFSSFEESVSQNGKFAKLELTARKCWRMNGAQRFLRFVIVDRGAPGISADIARMWWSRTWKGLKSPIPANRRDRGRIQAGNIMILA